jgi:thiamine biosynthesis protein ThiI
MEKVIIIRYAEIHLKGKNRGWFEKVFAVNIEKNLKGIRHELRRLSGRYLVENFNEEDTDTVVNRLMKVFGIHSISIAQKVSSDMQNIYEAALSVCPETGTFKVETHRADKTFSLNSMQISAEIGGKLLETNKNLIVDVHNPQSTVYIDLRENGTALVFGKFFKGAGGMPVGTAGKGMLLLSGGIDSPVAGYMIAKRGMSLECIHFHSYPYTNMMAKEKVIELAKILSPYTCGIKLNIVSVTHIQEEIHKNCNADYMVTLLRRFMMRLSERIAIKNGAQCIITGESLAQVASQTIEGMTSSNSVIGKLPVLRPLCGFDKDEIIERSRAIGTYTTSIEPYEDCCTVFLPEHPVTRPKLAEIEAEESKLNVALLIDEALSNIEVIKV